ncbi:MAG: EamA family transporter, partial [Pontibacterium sp.]
LEIILIGCFANQVDVMRSSCIQLLIAGLLAFIFIAPMREPLPTFGWYWVTAAIGLGFASALIQWAMNWAQRHVSPTRASIIYAGEPVWAGLFGWLAGEVLDVNALIGAAMIVLAVLISELKFSATNLASSLKDKLFH